MNGIAVFFPSLSRVGPLGSYLECGLLIMGPLRSEMRAWWVLFIVINPLPLDFDSCTLLVQAEGQILIQQII